MKSETKIKKFNSKFLTINECCDFLNKSLPTIYALVKDGTLKIFHPETLIIEYEGELFRKPKHKTRKPFILKSSAKEYQRLENGKSKAEGFVRGVTKRGVKIKVDKGDGTEPIIFISKTAAKTWLGIPQSKFKKHLDGEKMGNFSITTFKE